MYRLQLVDPVTAAQALNRRLGDAFRNKVEGRALSELYRTLRAETFPPAERGALGSFQKRSR
jgi:hypothetical protein